MANAILVDREKGLFVTNAHVVDNANDFTRNEHHLYLPHTRQWCRAQGDSRWIDWKADLAYLRLQGQDLSRYEVLPIKRRNSHSSDRVKVIGHPPVMEHTEAVEAEATVLDWNYVFPIENRGRTTFTPHIWLSWEKNKGPRSGSAVVDDENCLAGFISSALRFRDVQSRSAETYFSWAIPASRIDLAKIPLDPAISPLELGLRSLLSPTRMVGKMIRSLQ